MPNPDHDAPLAGAPMAHRVGPPGVYGPDPLDTSRGAHAGISRDRTRQAEPRVTCASAGGGGGTGAAVVADDWRRWIRLKVREGRLPRARAAAAFSNSGRAGRCDGCDLPIARSEKEFHARFSDGRTLHFHAECFVVWYAESDRASR